jgi:hypothetical protein
MRVALAAVAMAYVALGYAQADPAVIAANGQWTTLEDMGTPRKACGVQAASNGGTFLLSGASDRAGVLRLSLHKPTWQIPDLSVPVVLSFSGGVVLKLIGTGKQATIRVDMRDAAVKSLIHELTVNSAVTMTLPEGHEPPWQLDLTGTTPTVLAMARCLEAQQIWLPPPFAEQSAPAAAPSPVATSTVDAKVAAMAALLKKAESNMGHDNAAAYLTLTELANQGNAKAEVDLGTMFQGGFGIPTDNTTAVTLFRRAAEQGDIVGEINLGTAYEDGQGIQKDYVSASEWLSKAANGSDANISPLAQTLLGQIYQQGGYGVARDTVQAYKWFDIAAAHKSIDPNVDGTGCTGTDATCPAVLQRDSLAATMTQAQIDEGKRLALEWNH